MKFLSKLWENVVQVFAVVVLAALIVGAFALLLFLAAGGIILILRGQWLLGSGFIASGLFLYALIVTIRDYDGT